MYHAEGTDSGPTRCQLPRNPDRSLGPPHRGRVGSSPTAWGLACGAQGTSGAPGTALRSAACQASAWPAVITRPWASVSSSSTPAWGLPLTPSAYSPQGPLPLCPRSFYGLAEPPHCVNGGQEIPGLGKASMDGHGASPSPPSAQTKPLCKGMRSPRLSPKSPRWPSG